MFNFGVLWDEQVIGVIFVVPTDSFLSTEANASQFGMLPKRNTTSVPEWLSNSTSESSTPTQITSKNSSSPSTPSWLTENIGSKQKNDNVSTTKQTGSSFNTSSTPNWLTEEKKDPPKEQLKDKSNVFKSSSSIPNWLTDDTPSKPPPLQSIQKNKPVAPSWLSNELSSPSPVSVSKDEIESDYSTPTRAEPSRFERNPTSIKTSSQKTLSSTEDVSQKEKKTQPEAKPFPLKPMSLSQEEPKQPPPSEKASLSEVKAEGKESLSTLSSKKQEPPPVEREPSQPKILSPRDVPKIESPLVREPSQPKILSPKKETPPVEREPSQPKIISPRDAPKGSVGPRKGLMNLGGSTQDILARLNNAPWNAPQPVTEPEPVEEEEEEDGEQQAVHYVVCGPAPTHTFIFNWGGGGRKKKKKKKLAEEGELSFGALKEQEEEFSGGEEEEAEEEVIPEAVFLRIFSFLPPPDLASARLVCSEWRELCEPLWAAAKSRRSSRPAPTVPKPKPVRSAEEQASQRFAAATQIVVSSEDPEGAVLLARQFLSRWDKPLGTPSGVKGEAGESWEQAWDQVQQSQPGGSFLQALSHATLRATALTSDSVGPSQRSEWEGAVGGAQRAFREAFAHPTVTTATAVTGAVERLLAAAEALPLPPAPLAALGQLLSQGASQVSQLAQALALAAQAEEDLGRHVTLTQGVLPSLPVGGAEEEQVNGALDAIALHTGLLLSAVLSTWTHPPPSHTSPLRELLRTLEAAVQVSPNVFPDQPRLSVNQREVSRSLEGLRKLVDEFDRTATRVLRGEEGEDPDLVQRIANKMAKQAALAREVAGTVKKKESKKVLQESAGRLERAIPEMLAYKDGKKARRGKELEELIGRIRKSSEALGKEHKKLLPPSKALLSLLLQLQPTTSGEGVSLPTAMRKLHELAPSNVHSQLGPMATEGERLLKDYSEGPRLPGKEAELLQWLQRTEEEAERVGHLTPHSKGPLQAIEGAITALRNRIFAVPTALPPLPSYGRLAEHLEGLALQGRQHAAATKDLTLRQQLLDSSAALMGAVGPLQRALEAWGREPSQANREAVVQRVEEAQRLAGALVALFPTGPKGYHSNGGLEGALAGLLAHLQRSAAGEEALHSLLSRLRAAPSPPPPALLQAVEGAQRVSRRVAGTVGRWAPPSVALSLRRGAVEDRVTRVLRAEEGVRRVEAEREREKALTAALPLSPAVGLEHARVWEWLDRLFDVLRDALLSSPPALLPLLEEAMKDLSLLRTQLIQALHRYDQDPTEPNRVQVQEVIQAIKEAVGQLGNLLSGAQKGVLDFSLDSLEGALAVRAKEWEEEKKEKGKMNAPLPAPSLKPNSLEEYFSEDLSPVPLRPGAVTEVSDGLGEDGVAAAVEALASNLSMTTFNLFDFEFLNSNIFNSDFFLMEIARLKTKYEYDNERRLTGDIRRKQKVKFPKTTDELLQICEREEVFATKFAEKGEYEWARMLIKHATLIRMSVYENLLLPETNASSNQIQKQQFQIEKNWEKLVFLCLKGKPANDTSEQGCESTLSILKTTAELAPIQVRDARSPQYVNLWENRVACTLAYYEAVFSRQGPVDVVIREYLTPLLQEVPYYLDRNNLVLLQLWNATASIHDAVGTMVVRHGIPSYKEYLLQLHAYFHDRINEDDSLPNCVSDAFPLFPDVCYTLSRIHLNEKNYAAAQEFAVEEMMLYLEMDEEHQDDTKILDAWARVFRCVKKMYVKSSDQFFLLKEVLQEISVYSNLKLKNRIQQDMNSVGNEKEVRYNLRYTQQLHKCAQVFFGEMYEEVSEKLDGSALLQEILNNLPASVAPLEDLIPELDALSNLNYDFQFELMKGKDYLRARKIIEENLLIRKKTQVPRLNENQQVIIDEKVVISFELLIDCSIALSHLTSKAPAMIQTLIQCYEHRPLYFSYENEKLQRLWTEMIGVKEFYQETLEGLYKKVATDKRQVQEERALLEETEGKKGWLTLRINKTWQPRWAVLQQGMLFLYKSPSSLRPRGLLPLAEAEIEGEVEGWEDGVQVPAPKGQCWLLRLPWRSYFCCADSPEEAEAWKGALRRHASITDPITAASEGILGRQLLARHPLTLPALKSLGEAWEEQGHHEEALVIYVQGLELATYENHVELIRVFWKSIYDLLVKTKNIYEILEFLEEEQDRWAAMGLPPSHTVHTLIAQSLAKITREEDLKLRYMYQIRMYKEVTEDIVPSRLYFLNLLYAQRFLELGSIPEAISLTKDTLDLLARFMDTQSQDDPMLLYYHMSTWHQLVVGFLSFLTFRIYTFSTHSNWKKRETITKGEFFSKGLSRVILRTAWIPSILTSTNWVCFLSFSLSVDEIVRLFDADPETSPHSGAPMTDSAAFKWMQEVFQVYDEAVSKVYPSEALGQSAGVLTYRKLLDKEKLVERKKEFIGVIKLHPYMLNICSKMGQSYYVGHQLERALHMARHSLHIMLAAMPNRHVELEAQWRLTKTYFLAQRHSNAEVKTFIEEEQLFASVFLPPDHPLCARIRQDLKRLASKIAIYEKYIPAAASYLLYLCVFGVIAYFVSWDVWVAFTSYFAEYTSVWLLGVAIYLDLGLLLTAMLFLSWPPLPSDTLHRTSVLLKRKKAIRNVALMIACGEVLPQTLRAALRIFPPQHIYVCDNGNFSQPTDNSKEVCDKISHEYHLQHNLPLDSPKINYFYMSEGNKSLVFWYGAKYYCHYKYCMLIDDDVQLPPDLIIPMKRFKIPGTKVLAFTLGVENLHTHQGNIIYTTFWQDLEYKLAGFMKMFQSWMGSAIMAHGAISLWERKTLMEVLWNHDTVFHGDDLQMGLILQKLGREYRIDTVGNVNVPTTVPDHVVCPTRPWTLRCCCPGKDGNLLGQRVRSWDVSTHRFIGKFLNILILHWGRTTISMKPFILYEMWSIFQDWFRIPMALVVLYYSPLTFVQVNLFFVCLGVALIIMFNFWVLRRRPDQQHPWRTLLPFPLYKLMTIFFRWIALWYNLFYYTPFVRNRQILGTRQDLPLGPRHVAVLQELARPDASPPPQVTPPPAYEWGTIARLLRAESRTSPRVSHWFLAGLARWLVAQRHSPRAQISAGFRSQSSLVGSSHEFFYPRLPPRAIPLTLISVLNALSFLADIPRCLGSHPLRAAKILKWLWLEDSLASHLHDTTLLLRALGDFDSQCPKGISLYQFVVLMREVVRPTLQFLDASAQVASNILHLQVGKDEGGWNLKNLSLAASDDKLILRLFAPEILHKGLESNQRWAIFVPLPSSAEVFIEPFKPSAVHAVLLLDPSEGLLIVFNPQDALLERVYAVLHLLRLDPQLFPNLHVLSPTKVTLAPLYWPEVEQRANYFFNDPTATPGIFLEETVPEKAPLALPLTLSDEGCTIKHNTISASGFWLFPVLDILDGPILFLDEEDRIIDGHIYFEPYEERLPKDYQITTRPSVALKEKILNSSTSKFLVSLTAQQKVSEKWNGPLDVVVFRVTRQLDGRYEFQILKFNDNTLMQNILVDYLAFQFFKKVQRKSVAKKAILKWKSKSKEKT